MSGLTDTDPKPFFDILEIDKKIGWIKAEHLESRVFTYKAIKVIKDENVNYNNHFAAMSNTKFRIGMSG